MVNIIKKLINSTILINFVKLNIMKYLTITFLSYLSGNFDVLITSNAVLISITLKYTYNKISKRDVKINVTVDPEKVTLLTINIMMI